jgi:hypothetical protein
LRTRKNDFDGIDVYISEGDSLSDVPNSHAALITPEVRKAFEDPRGYFQSLARSASLPAFRRYLLELTTYEWQLVLSTSTCHAPAANFGWAVESWATPHFLFMEPGITELEEQVHPEFAQLFAKVRSIAWSGYDSPGELERPAHDPIGRRILCESDTFPAATSKIFGHMSSGDALVYNEQGEAGFLSHECGAAYRLGTVREALSWLFDELRQGREPDFDYKRESYD